MGCRINTYPVLHKKLNLPQDIVIVRRGFAEFYSAPPRSKHSNMLTTLGLELAYSKIVEDFNCHNSFIESRHAKDVINRMNSQALALIVGGKPRLYQTLHSQFYNDGGWNKYVIVNEDSINLDNYTVSATDELLRELRLILVPADEFKHTYPDMEWGKVSFFVAGKEIDVKPVQVNLPPHEPIQCGIGASYKSLLTKTMMGELFKIFQRIEREKQERKAERQAQYDIAQDKFVKALLEYDKETGLALYGAHYRAASGEITVSGILDHTDGSVNVPPAIKSLYDQGFFKDLSNKF